MLFDVFTYIFGTTILIKVYKRLKQRVSFFYILTVVFYVFQFVPILVGLFYKEDDVFVSAPNIAYAMNDSVVAIVYDVVVLFILYVLFKLGGREDNYLYMYIDRIRDIQFSKPVNCIIIGCILSPLIAVFYAPDPSVYFKFAYFYANEATIWEELYHYEVMNDFLNFSLASIVAYHLQKKKVSLVSFIGVLFITWLSSKRTVMVFGFIAIIMIDIFKGTYEYRLHVLARKILFYVVIIIGYFMIYTSFTGKGEDNSFYGTYTMYYSRDYSIKTVIYDNLHGATMLDYPGQSILFDCFFYIPRSLWPETKPIMFSKYFTTYCKGHDIDDIVSTNYYVNLWAEHIANFGFLGILTAFCFILVVLKISQQSDNACCYFLGLTFILFYFFWGVQPFVMLIICFWAISALVAKLKLI